ncbi:heme ABC transporter ATP-binding protein/permease CydC [Proteus vulgaris]|uniref:heme ABC transporter ATP-binding protein/permease CydC n=1 Tax=Proteus vulgaris TaxID=585 RepID=UPI000F505C29|nr:cysteine/glutathione ABC transporter ATP-binding protein/permease CydC [Proteus vulgaris]AYY80021.1 cysteine/glutathione ABC transporter ATP-binding protein/permease CydC [Proteus vulgaris]MDM3562593.1 cysteine/glutathione ABC transporter ATP-binding protein/permease CydC [Proteus vulgaris]
MRVLLPFLALYRRHWFMLLLGIILAILTLLASIGLLTLSGWFLAGTSLAGFAGIYSFNYMLPAAGVRGAAIFRTAGRYFERLVSHDATFRVLSHLRVFTFKKILPLSPGGIARFRQGELLNRLVADVETLDHLYIRVISPIIAAFVVIMMIMFGLGLIDAHLANTLGGIMLTLLIILPFVFYYAGKPIGRDLTDLRGQYRTVLTSMLQGQAELTVFGALPRFRQNLAQLEAKWLRRQAQQANLTGLSQSLMILASGLTATLILWLAAGGIDHNFMPEALIALFTFCALAAFESLAPVTVAFQHLGQVMASATRISHLIEQKPDVSFPEKGGERKNSASLTLHNICFTYPTQPMQVINHVDLTIEAGQHIALLGKTGCGKSTLLQLINRAFDPTHGTIRLNNSPIANYDETTLRSMMSVVPQRVHVFSHTLRENLIMAKEEATDEELSHALQQVGLGHLLDNDEGLNAWMGDGGRQLSGGEQRRLGLARALLHNAPLVLLDEPTEGLDADTEQQILTLLHQHCQGKAVLMITHRLHGLDKMDKICVMDGGKIVETGTHASLLQQQGHYAKFHQRQALLTPTHEA